MAYLLKELPEDSVIAEFSTKYTKLSPPYFGSLLKILKLAADLDQHMNHYFQLHDLSDGRYSILHLLYRSGSEKGMIQSDLAKKINVTRSSMTSFIDCLEKAKLIQRVSDEKDRRVFYIQLTKLGREKIEKILPEHMQMMSRLMKCLNDSEAKQLNSILEKLLNNMDEAFDPEKCTKKTK